jgi:hypothetical protein
MVEREGHSVSLGASSEASLEAQLAEALPGFEALDRDLVLGDVRADLVGCFGDGRLALVHRVDQTGGEVVTAALDLLAAAREHTPFLARHLGARVEAPAPLVVIVAAQVDERSARRLSALGPDTVRLLELRAITSARASSTFLVPHGTEARPAGGAVLGERLADLAEPARARVEVLLERLRRIDEELGAATTDAGLEWRWRGRLVCALQVVEGEAQALVTGGEPRGLGSDDALETFVDGALARWSALVEEAEGLDTVEP